MGDEQRVLQIARVLVENALVHTPEGTFYLLVRSPIDDEADLALPVWAGLIPLGLRSAEPVAADGVLGSPPTYATEYERA